MLDILLTSLHKDLHAYYECLGRNWLNICGSEAHFEQQLCREMKHIACPTVSEVYEAYIKQFIYLIFGYCFYNLSIEAIIIIANSFSIQLWPLPKLIIT
jgi:hypothetical protein